MIGEESVIGVAIAIAQEKKIYHEQKLKKSKAIRDSVRRTLIKRSKK